MSRSWAIDASDDHFLPMWAKSTLEQQRKEVESKRQAQYGAINYMSLEEWKKITGYYDAHEDSDDSLTPDNFYPDSRAPDATAADYRPPVGFFCPELATHDHSDPEVFGVRSHQGVTSNGSSGQRGKSGTLGEREALRGGVFRVPAFGRESRGRGHPIGEGPHLIPEALPTPGEVYTL
jgi:hypothetical protein